MNDHQRDEHLRTAYRTADQEWRAVNEAAHPSPDQPARRGMKPRAGRKPGHRDPLREN